MSRVEAEGWYLDPYKLHTDRWFSAGRPTALVRDGDAESHDPPPPQPYEGELTESPTDDFAEAGDSQRPSSNTSGGLWERGLGMWSEAGNRDDE